MDFINQFFDSQFWQHFFAINSSPWRIFISIVDVAIVAFLIYWVIKFVQGTRLMILVRGIVIFIVVYFIAELFGLGTLKWLLAQVITYGVIALIVIFQPEIRAALERLGRTPNFFAIKPISSRDMHIAAYEKAFHHLSKRKIGALIAVERTQRLDEYAASGIRLDADITSELLINIFIPNTPLHDGAVIIQEGKIAVSSAYFPLTERTDISKQFGTRHRAAIGLSELSDALVLVVSEETGGISVVLKGIIHAELTAEQFHQLLVDNLTETRENSQGLSGLATWFRKSEAKK